MAEDMSKGNDLSAFEEREISVTRPGLFVYNRANQSTANQVLKSIFIFIHFLFLIS